MISLVLGGARSGKSEIGERLALRRAGEVAPATGGATVTYVATARTGLGDAEFDERIARHRLRRPADWATLEVVVGASLQAPLSTPGVVLVDSLGTWVAGQGEFLGDVDALVEGLEERRGAGWPTVLVSDEVGLGVHPATPLGLAFREALGAVNRRVAEIADDVRLVVAGRVLLLPVEDS